MRYVIAVAALTLALAGTAEAGGATLRVGAKPVTWVSPDRHEVFRLRVFANGRELRYGLDGCRLWAYGRGVAVELDPCGRGAQRLRVSAVTVRTRPVRLHVRY